MSYIFIILTILLWGSGAFVGKQVLRGESSMYIYILEAFGTLTIVGIVSLFYRKEFASAVSNFNWGGYAFGILWGLGTVTFVVALKHKPASIVVPLTALYPLATALLAIFYLGEAVTLKTGAGIVCAILAAILLA